MDTLHCPRCDLRFRFANELRDHLDHDHPRARAPAHPTSGINAA